MHLLIIAGIVIVGLVWIIGSFSALGDLLDNGKSLKVYRDKYGHDLGMLVCFTHRGLMFSAWPIVGFGGFFIGLVRDSIKIFFHGTNK